jgi:hypothetical protein
VEVAQIELFIGGMCILIRQPNAEQDRGRPRISWNVATTGIEPPSRLKTGSCPNPCLIARPAACTYLLSNSVIHGLPPCIRVTFTSTVFGAIFFT